MSSGDRVIPGRILSFGILRDQRAVVLSRGQFAPSQSYLLPLQGDVWQCLGTFLVVTTGAEAFLAPSG